MVVLGNITKEKRLEKSDNHEVQNAREHCMFMKNLMIWDLCVISIGGLACMQLKEIQSILNVMEKPTIIQILH